MSTPSASGRHQAKTGAVADRLHALLEPVVAGAGFDLEAVRVTQMGRRRNVEVVVDRDGGVSMDAVADASRVIDAALDGPEGVAVLGEQEYLLEVSSPGTDRPLTLPRHWRRAEARLVKAQLTNGAEVLGRVLAGDDDGVLIEAQVKPPKPGMRTDKVEEKRFAYSEIAKARVEIEFNRKDEEELVEGEDFEDEDDEDFDDEDEETTTEHEEG